MEVEWRDWRDYKVSNEGIIMNKTGHIMKPFKHYRKGKLKRPNAYSWCIHVTCLGIKRRYKVHQIIADCFLPPKPTNGLYCIDHIDGNKDNNKAENLRWCEWNENALKGNTPLYS